MTDSLNDRFQRFDQIVAFTRSAGLESLADNWNNTRKALVDSHIRIVVLGEFNHGKSSLLNGLIGEAVLPSGVTPTTQIDTHIHLGQDSRRVCACSGNQIVYEWNWDEWLKTANRSMPDVLRERSVDRLEIYLDSAPFDESCVFIDTPGLNEAFLARESFLKRYLKQADFLIFVFDANQVLTHTEQTILKELNTDLTAEQRILVINKCDRLDDEEWLDICHYVESSLAPVLGDNRFYMVSARKKKVGDWRDLMLRICTDIEKSKSGHALDAVNRQCDEMLSILDGALLMRHALAELENVDLNLISKLRPHMVSSMDLAGVLHDISIEINRLEKQTSSDFTRFENDFLKAMPRELDKSNLDDIENYFEDFIDESFALFAESTVSRLVENLNQIVVEGLRHLICLTEAEFPMIRIPFDEIDKMRRNPVSTGAFDASGGLALWNLPLPGLVSSRAERPRREALKLMAEKAIQCRAEQYIQAFSDELKHWNDVLTTYFRERGMLLHNDIIEMIHSVESGNALDDELLLSLR